MLWQRIAESKIGFTRTTCNFLRNFFCSCRGSRERNWELHQYSLHLLCPYFFFAFDMTNYTCMTPIYLLQMPELKERDKTAWDLFARGSFSVSKSEASFTLIGLDHDIEQEKRVFSKESAVSFGRRQWNCQFKLRSRSILFNSCWVRKQY